MEQEPQVEMVLVLFLVLSLLQVVVVVDLTIVIMGVLAAQAVAEVLIQAQAVQELRVKGSLVEMALNTITTAAVVAVAVLGLLVPMQ